MGDRVYAHIELGGQVETVAEIEELCAAIAAEGVTDSTSDTAVTDEEVAKSTLRWCVENEVPPSFHGNEVNYGVFNIIEAAVLKIPGLCCTTDHEAGGGFATGRRTIMPDGSEHHCPENGDDGTLVSFSELEKARAADDPLTAIDALITQTRIASGAELPDFTVSPAVATWLKIFGAKAA